LADLPGWAYCIDQDLIDTVPRHSTLRQDLVEVSVVASRKAEEQRVTLQSIADRLAVSRTTVSNAYSRPDQLNPKLRERILQTADELGYCGPDPAARTLRSGHAGVVGVLLAERLSYAFTDPAAVRFLQGVAQVGEREGTGLLLLPPSSPDGAGPPAGAARAAVGGRSLAVGACSA